MYCSTPCLYNFRLMASLVLCCFLAQFEEERERLRENMEKMARRNAEFSADVKSAQEQRDKVRTDNRS